MTTRPIGASWRINAGLGHPATCAAGAQEAWKNCRIPTKPFDVVVLDMHMPGMNGITLAEVIKADPGWRARA
jgi:CheY-like chemotaxis protein